MTNDFVWTELKRGLRFTDTVGRTTVPIHLLFTVVQLSHVDIVGFAENRTPL